MMASVSSRQAPFLKFSDSVPEWTVGDDDGSHSNNDSPNEEHNSNNSGSSESGCCSAVGHQQWREPITSSAVTTAAGNDRIVKTAMTAMKTTINDNPTPTACPMSQGLGTTATADAPAPSSQIAKFLPHFKHREGQILSDFQNKKIYLFLDYDGTLTPIVPDPAQAFLSERMRTILFDLANSDHVIVGIVTGRALTSVKRFVQITASEQLKFLYAASHGFHIEAAGQQLHHKVGASFIPMLREAALKISRMLGHIPGLTLEDNEFSVSVHYRNCPADSAAEVESAIDVVLSSYPGLRKTRGKMVFELRINLAWDKGRAVMWLLQAMDVNPCDPNVRIVYIGDDLTDEDAFKAIRQHGSGHLAILVSDTNIRTQSSYSHRSTAASLFVDGTDEVADFLTSIQRVASLTPSPASTP